jgi:predicted GNAT superfamily acetyltransferase
VRPDRRGTGLATELYERFFTVARANGRTLVRCVTSPLNEGSIAFHRALGFTIDRGEEHMLFSRSV